MHCVTCVQGGHLVGSLKSAAVQVVASRIGCGAPGTVQQPKQSQPLGTSFWHLSMQVCDCDDEVEHSVVCVCAYCWSYGQLASVLRGSHLSCQRQPSSPLPELPSKKQSRRHGAALSPGMPVANELSSLSSGPTHSGSA